MPSDAPDEKVRRLAVGKRHEAAHCACELPVFNERKAVGKAESDGVFLTPHFRDAAVVKKDRRRRCSRRVSPFQETHTVTFRHAAQYRSSRRWISSISLWSKSSVRRPSCRHSSSNSSFPIWQVPRRTMASTILRIRLLACVVVQHLRQHRYFQNIVPAVDFPVAVPVYAGM